MIFRKNALFFRLMFKETRIFPILDGRRLYNGVRVGANRTGKSHDHAHVSARPVIIRGCYKYYQQDYWLKHRLPGNMRITHNCILFYSAII